jgi:hypothetical protein
MTVVGRNTDTTHAIAASDARLGVESSNDWLDGFDIHFLDFPFTDPDATVGDHIAVAADVQPEVAVAPDIEKGRTLSEVVEVADRLAQYAQEVIVVPKTVHPSEVPDRFRVGVPAANYGSNARWSVWDYRECGPVHILGGSPNRQCDIGDHLHVASVDTATLGKVSRFGYWDGKTVDAPDEWDYRRRLRESLDNYAEVWRRA